MSFSERVVRLSSILHKVPTSVPHANVIGVGVHALTLVTAVRILQQHVLQGRKGYVCVTGVHGVMEARRSAAFHDVLLKALLVVPDGMPTVWMGRLQRLYMSRVFGPDLMSHLCAECVTQGATHFLYGGKPGVADKLRARLEQSFPGIKVVGTFTPPFRPLNNMERNNLESIISHTKPDIIWIGLSTPTQECFMSEMIDRLDCKLMIGVGAAFDIHTGNIKDAPDWIKKSGLQWLHRLVQEPRRLWRRYLTNNSEFLWHAMLQLSGLRRYELRQSVAEFGNPAATQLPLSRSQPLSDC